MTIYKDICNSECKGHWESMVCYGLTAHQYYTSTTSRRDTIPKDTIDSVVIVGHRVMVSQGLSYRWGYRSSIVAQSLYLEYINCISPSLYLAPLYIVPLDSYLYRVD